MTDPPAAHMTVRNRLLLGSALGSTVGGAAALVLGVTGGVGFLLPDAPGAVASLFAFAGFVCVLVGVYALVTWVALAEEGPGRAYVALADRYAAEGKVEYARTYYEEALRWGADPAEVEDRLALCEARSTRAATHREPL